jgi:tetratricopeptide (TPR) repeat protein
LPDDITPGDLDKDVRAELLPLARGVADTVARHLVATGRLIDDDPEEALAHALAARRLASRIAAVREAVGLAAYHAREWQTAISELRTYHRMTGRQTHLAVLADCERALGRPERAIDLYRGADRDALAPAEAGELRVFAVGSRADLGQRDAAVTMLQVRELAAPAEEPWAARLRYAYADALLSVGRRDEAREWFARAADADEDSETDAAERLLDIDGVVIEGDEDEDGEDEDGDDVEEDVEDEDGDDVEEDVEDEDGDDVEEDVEDEGEEIRVAEVLDDGLDEDELDDEEAAFDDEGEDEDGQDDLAETADEYGPDQDVGNDTVDAPLAVLADHGAAGDEDDAERGLDDVDTARGHVDPDDVGGAGPVDSPAPLADDDAKELPDLGEEGTPPHGDDRA